MILSFLLYYSILFILWAIFGSFSTVLISRWHTKEWGILLGRSHCPHCWHTLRAEELIPIGSFLWQNGKCKNCKTRIPFFYPLAELLLGIIFMLMGYTILELWIFPIGWELLFLLMLGFITGVYILYDIRYMEIPDQIMIPWILLLSGVLIGSIFIPNLEWLFFDRDTYLDIETLVQDHFFWAWVLYSFLYLQIFIPGTMHCLRNRYWKQWFELSIGYITFPVMMIVYFFVPRLFANSENTEEIPSWIGWGDLRIALFIGLSLGTIHGIASFFFAYIVGSIIGILLILRDKNRKREIPFGPFLGMGWIFAIVFHREILEYISIILNI